MNQKVDLSKFDLSSKYPFSKPKYFINNDGFSFRLRYPNNWCNQKLNDNEFSLLRFKFEENSKENDLINIEIYVELYKEIEPGSYYLAKNRNKSILGFNPIDIEFNKTFRFSLFDQCFYRINEKIKFEELVNVILLEHLKTNLGKLKFLYKFKYGFIEIRKYIYNKSFDLFFQLVHILFGYNYSEEEEIKNIENKILDENNSNSPIFSERKDLHIFNGYKTNTNTLISFSVFFILSFYILYDYIKLNKTIEFIVNNSLMSFLLGFVLIAVYEKIIKNIFVKILKFISSLNKILNRDREIVD